MCDTMGKLNAINGFSVFAKNSDRHYDEPQVMLFVPAKDHEEKTLKATYIEIEQAEHTHAVLLSRPVWMWGAEMGVNEFGVCIGNEAIMSNVSSKAEKALIGMDLVRLGLERGKSAKEALDIMIALLLKYGQGGNCGYSSEMFYENSFLIMDREEIYVLETYQKNYAYKKYDLAAISNCLSISNADFSSNVKNFKKKFTDIVRKPAQMRRRFALRRLRSACRINDIFNILRSHSSKEKQSICMHGEFESTNSMVVVLKETPVIYFTACPNPCKAEYLRYVFGEPPAYPINTEAHPDNCEFWKSKRYPETHGLSPFECRKGL